MSKTSLKCEECYSIEERMRKSLRMSEKSLLGFALKIHKMIIHPDILAAERAIGSRYLIHS